MPDDTHDDALFAVLQAELGADVSTLSPDTALADLADSLQWYEIFDTLELALDTRISIEQGLGLHSLGDLARLLAQSSAG